MSAVPQAKPQREGCVSWWGFVGASLQWQLAFVCGQHRCGGAGGIICQLASSRSSDCAVMCCAVLCCAAGKTMLAKAVAHHTTAAFIRVVGSEFVQKYLGEVRG